MTHHGFVCNSMSVRDGGLYSGMEIYQLCSQAGHLCYPISLCFWALSNSGALSVNWWSPPTLPISPLPFFVFLVAVAGSKSKLRSVCYPLPSTVLCFCDSSWHWIAVSLSWVHVVCSGCDVLCIIACLFSFLSLNRRTLWRWSSCDVACFVLVCWMKT